MTEQEELARLLWARGILRCEADAPLRWSAPRALADETAREALLTALLSLIQEHYGAAQALLGGDWAALAAARLELPLEPASMPDRPLLIVGAVEDGAPEYDRTAPLRAQGASPAIAALFCYGDPRARQRLDKADVRLHWLLDREAAAAVGLQEGYLDLDAYERILEA